MCKKYKYDKKIKLLNLNKMIKIDYDYNLLFEFNKKLNEYKNLIKKYSFNEVNKKNNTSSILNFLFSKNSTIGTNKIEKVNIDNIVLSEQFIEKTNKITLIIK